MKGDLHPGGSLGECRNGRMPSFDSFVASREGRRQTNSCCRTHLSVMVASLRMALALALFQAVARAGSEFADGAPR